MDRDPRWVPARRPEFLLPGRALSIVFRAKFRDALRKAGLLDQVPAEVWSKNWVVHLQHAGNGEKVLDYLARYVFRIALVNSRLEHFDHRQVTFRYRDGRTGTIKRCTLDPPQFIARFLQHVLPRGFSKVRYYGLFSPSRKPLLVQARAQLVAPPASPPSPAPLATDLAARSVSVEPVTPRCPFCGIGVLQVIETLPRCRRFDATSPAPTPPPGRFMAQLVPEPKTPTSLRPEFPCPTPAGRPPAPSPASPRSPSRPTPHPQSRLKTQVPGAFGLNSTRPFAAAPRGKKP